MSAVHRDGGGIFIAVNPVDLPGQHIVHNLLRGGDITLAAQAVDLLLQNPARFALYGVFSITLPSSHRLRCRLSCARHCGILGLCGGPIARSHGFHSAADAAQGRTDGGVIQSLREVEAGILAVGSSLKDGLHQSLRKFLSALRNGRNSHLAQGGAAKLPGGLGDGTIQNALAEGLLEGSRHVQELLCGNAQSAAAQSIGHLLAQGAARVSCLLGGGACGAEEHGREGAAAGEGAHRHIAQHLGTGHARIHQETSHLAKALLGFLDILLGGGAELLCRLLHGLSGGLGLQKVLLRRLDLVGGLARFQQEVFLFLCVIGILRLVAVSLQLLLPLFHVGGQVVLPGHTSGDRLGGTHGACIGAGGGLCRAGDDACQP